MLTHMISSGMMRFGCGLLSLVMLTSPLAAQNRPAMDPVSLKMMLLNVPNGSPVTVRTRDGERLAGKLLDVTNSGFEVQALVNDNIETRTLAYSDVASFDAGPRQRWFARVLNPIMMVLTMVGAAAALTAAIQ